VIYASQCERGKAIAMASARLAAPAQPAYSRGEPHSQAAVAAEPATPQRSEAHDASDSDGTPAGETPRSARERVQDRLGRAKWRANWRHDKSEGRGSKSPGSSPPLQPARSPGRTPEVEAVGLISHVNDSISEAAWQRAGQSGDVANGRQRDVIDSINERLDALDRTKKMSPPLAIGARPADPLDLSLSPSPPAPPHGGSTQSPPIDEFDEFGRTALLTARSRWEQYEQEHQAKHAGMEQDPSRAVSRAYERAQEAVQGRQDDAPIYSYEERKGASPPSGVPPVHHEPAAPVDYEAVPPIAVPLRSQIPRAPNPTSNAGSAVRASDAPADPQAASSSGDSPPGIVMPERAHIEPPRSLSARRRRIAYLEKKDEPLVNRVPAKAEPSPATMDRINALKARLGTMGTPSDQPSQHHDAQQDPSSGRSIRMPSFDSFDVNGDGVISRDEFAAGMKSVNAQGRARPPLVPPLPLHGLRREGGGER